MAKRGIIFDLDGTLWDVTDAATYTANEITKKYGLPAIDVNTVKSAFGQPREGSARIYFPYFPLQKSLPLIDEIIALSAVNILKTGGNLYPDLIETLMLLNKGYDLFIVSNSPQNEYVKAFIDLSKTDKLFKNYYAAGAYGLTKAQAIKKAAEDNGLSRAVYIGDTDTDFQSAIEAGIKFIYANYGFGEVKDAEYVIGSLKELPKVLPRVFYK